MLSESLDENVESSVSSANTLLFADVSLSVAKCFNCGNNFVPTKTKFLFCSIGCSVTLSVSVIKKNTLTSKTNSSKKIVTYENIKSMYESKECRLITSKEDFTNMRNTTPLKSVVFDIISKCGHASKSHYYSFLCNNSGMLCKECTLKRSKHILVSNAKTAEGRPRSLETQRIAIEIIKELCKDTFTIVKTRDGCDSDILIKPNENTNDSWLKIKVKSTIFKDKETRFKISKYYQSIHLMVSINTNDIWIFEPHEIQIRTYYMGDNRSMYDDNHIKSKENLIERLGQIYQEQKFVDIFQNANDPISETMKLEYYFLLKRESVINFLNFERADFAGAIFNFKIGTLKFQENVVSIQRGKNAIIANISKCCRQRKRIPYDQGDNDFYWINVNNLSYDFYVIPERTLIINGYISTPESIGNKYLNISSNDWTSLYKFNYSTINNQEEKDKLLTIINNI